MIHYKTVLDWPQEHITWYAHGGPIFDGQTICTPAKRTARARRLVPAKTTAAKFPFSSPESAILLVSAENRDLWFFLKIWLGMAGKAKTRPRKDEKTSTLAAQVAILGADKKEQSLIIQSKTSVSTHEGGYVLLLSNFGTETAGSAPSIYLVQPSKNISV